MNLPARYTPRPVAVPMEDLAFEGLRGLCMGGTVVVAVHVAQALASLGPLWFAVGLVCALDIVALGALFLRNPNERMKR